MKTDKRKLQFLFKMNCEAVAYVWERLYGFNFYKWYEYEKHKGEG